MYVLGNKFTYLFSLLVITLICKKKHIRKISHFNEIYWLTCYLLKNLNFKKKKVIIT